MPATLLASLLLVFLNAGPAFHAQRKDSFSGIPAEQQKQLQARLAEYVKAYRTRGWSNLYDLVSDTAKGGVARDQFIARMKSEHGQKFSNFPDLLDFTADRTMPNGKDEYDIYGCGQARREGMSFKGIALVHVVFERTDWHFAGWSFTEFPNEPCKLLKDPSWEPPDPMEWGQPMGELRSEPGLEFHTEKPK